MSPDNKSELLNKMHLIKIFAGTLAAEEALGAKLTRNEIYNQAYLIGQLARQAEELIDPHPYAAEARARLAHLRKRLSAEAQTKRGV